MAGAAPFLPMEAKSVADLPEGDGWQFEPKWDGFRCLAFHDGATTQLFAKSGKPLNRFFPEVAANLAMLGKESFVLDGELVIPTPQGPSFDALQARLHPAESRIRKLSSETPALFVAFDLPGLAEQDLKPLPLTQRREALEELLAADRAGLRLSPHTRSRAVARAWLDQGSGALDGVVAKALTGPYVPGERRMLKVKRLRTADCVVGGFRYGEGSRLAASLLLGLYDEAGLLHHVGFTSMISRAEAPALTEKLEGLRGEGFTGNAPGGPSRWSTERTATYEKLRPELVIEIAYDQITSGRFRHGTRLLRWRPDKAPQQCTFEQIAPPAKLSGPVAEVLAGLSRGP